MRFAGRVFTLILAALALYVFSGRRSDPFHTPGASACVST